MRVLTIFLGIAGVSAACGHSNVLPDGGRNIENCSPTYDTVTVKVVDGSSNPVSGATATATGAGSATSSATTNGAGIAVLGLASLGAGTLALSATTAAGKTSTPARSSTAAASVIASPIHPTSP